MIEPTDEMDNDPWNADLLDELATLLADRRYDLKELLAAILTSRAYQMPAVVREGEADDQYVFRGPGVRRMTAEQFSDAVSTVTGVWPGKLMAKVPDEDPKAVPARASLCPADPLTTSMGRPSREQVVTERPSAATTLQGLEMTNGKTLAAVLQTGAAKWASKQKASTDDSVRGLYNIALGRDPTPAELQTAEATVGTPAQAAGFEDLMWAVVMLPEFQLIR